MSEDSSTNGVILVLLAGFLAFVLLIINTIAVALNDRVHYEK